MSEHLKLDCLLIEPITEPDSILLGITLNPAISLVNINGRAHSPNSVVHQILLVRTEDRGFLMHPLEVDYDLDVRKGY